MWRNVNRPEQGCQRTCNWLEEAASTAPKAAVLEDLIGFLPEEERTHVRECQDCQEACATLLKSRELLSSMEPAEHAPKPYFAKRVLAVIRAKEQELERSTRTWAAVPRLAARLAGVVALLLVITGTLLLESPRRKQATGPAMQAPSAIFEDNATLPASKDEVLVSVLEKGQ